MTARLEATTQRCSHILAPSICLTSCECKGDTKGCDECTCWPAEWYEMWDRIAS